MSAETKRPTEWALELGQGQAKQIQGQQLIGDDGQPVRSVVLFSTAHNAANGLHYWSHDDYHAPPGGELRITRAAYEAALKAALTYVPSKGHVPVREALSPYAHESVQASAVPMSAPTTTARASARKETE